MLNAYACVVNMHIHGLYVFITCIIIAIADETYILNTCKY